MKSIISLANKISDMCNLECNWDCKNLVTHFGGTISINPKLDSQAVIKGDTNGFTFEVQSKDFINRKNIGVLLGYLFVVIKYPTPQCNSGFHFVYNSHISSHTEIGHQMLWFSKAMRLSSRNYYHILRKIGDESDLTFSLANKYCDCTPDEIKSLIEFY